MNKRIRGYDFARAFAIFGMVIVNFKIVMGASAGSTWLKSAAGLLEGRAAAVFVILAGVGISLMTAKARLGPSPALMAQQRVSLLKRAFLLIVVGLSYSPIWPADILHFYGFYIVVGVFLLSAKDRMLIISAIFFTMGFALLLLVFDYDAGWNWETLSYTDFWTFSGMIRHIFFNGFHPVFPWASFLLIGMWLGRQDMSSVSLRRKLLFVSFFIWVVTELLSDLAFVCFSELISNMSAEDIAALFATKPVPPMPQYILSAGSAAIFFIVCCISLTLKFANSRFFDVLCKTGQLSLTLYVAHVIIGMGFLEAIGRLENQTIEFALTSALVFNLLSIIFAWAWVSQFKTGPLEKIFRKLAG